MRLQGSSSAAPELEPPPQRGLRGFVLDDDSIFATADTSGGPAPGLAGTIRDSDTLTAQLQLLRPILDDDRLLATLGIFAQIRDDDQIRATAQTIVISAPIRDDDQIRATAALVAIGAPISDDDSVRATPEVIILDAQVLDDDLVRATAESANIAAAVRDDDLVRATAAVVIVGAAVLDDDRVRATAEAVIVSAPVRDDDHIRATTGGGVAATIRDDDQVKATASVVTISATIRDDDQVRAAATILAIFGTIRDDDQVRGTAEVVSVGATIRDDDQVRAAAQVVTIGAPVRDDDQIRATAQVIAIGATIRDDDEIRATAEIVTVTDFAYEHDFVLRKFTELPAETLVDFVVIGYELNSNSWKTVANGGRMQHAQAFDVQVVDIATSLQLDHNVVFYDGAAGILRLDFRIPSWNIANDYPFRIRHGMPGLTVTEANPAGCYRRASAAWTWPSGVDLRAGHNLTVIDAVSGTTMTGIGPVGQFGAASTAQNLAATWLNGLTAAALEMWLEPVATGAPVNLTPPVITGTSTVGQTLSVSNGTWSGNATITYTRSWQRNGVPISPAQTGTTHVAVTADVGTSLTCAVTATNGVGSTVAVSTPVSVTDVTTAAPPVNTTQPQITGTPIVGNTLTCSTGGWTSGTTITYGYVWRRDNVPISGQTNNTHVAATGDIGTSLTCAVTATNADGSTTIGSNGVSVSAGTVVTSANRPYPNSTLWEQITFTGAITRTLSTSDQHPSAMYADGSICDVGCDWTSPTPQTTAEIFRLTGTFPTAIQYTRRGKFGVNVVHGDSSDPNANQNLKAHAVACLPGQRVLFWYYRQFTQSSSNQCILSTDDGVTFPALSSNPADDIRVFRLGSGTENFQIKGVLHASPGMSIANLPPGWDNDYIYYVGHARSGGNVTTNTNNPAGPVYCCRYKLQGTGGSMAIADIRDRSRYSFFTGLDGNDNPTWTADGGLKTDPGVTPVFRNYLGGLAANDRSMCLYIAFYWHPTLAQWIVGYTPDDGSGDGGTTGPFKGIAIAHAPTPWDVDAWQMLCYDARLSGMAGTNEEGRFFGCYAPPTWYVGGRIGVGLSTSPGDRAAGAIGGDDLALFQSSILVPIDQTPTTPATFDERLPMGGMGIGIMSLLGTPGNSIINAGFGLIRVQAEHSGSISRMCYNSRFDAPAGAGNVGYHHVRGGTIYWSIRRITSAPGALPLTLGAEITRTDNIVNPAGSAIDGSGPWPGWQAQFVAAGRSGTVDEWFARFPVLTFRNSVQVTAGDWLAFTLHQVDDGSGGDISINHSFSTHHIQNSFCPYGTAWQQTQSGSAIDASIRMFVNGTVNQLRPELFPMLVYSYTDGFSAGNCHTSWSLGLGADRAFSLFLLTGRGVRHRQVIPIPAWANGRVIRRVHSMMIRYDNTTTADIMLRIRRGDGSADGALLGTVTIPANNIRYQVDQDLKGQNANPAGPIPFVVFDFSTISPRIAVASGVDYYAELASSSTGATTTRYFTDRPDRKLLGGGANASDTTYRYPSYIYPGMRGQENTGSGWVDMVGGAGVGSDQGEGADFDRPKDMPFWIEFEGA